MSNSIFRKDGTAQGVTKQRLFESLAKPENRVNYDPYADRFVLGATLIKLMGHKLGVWLTKTLAPGFHELASLTISLKTLQQMGSNSMSF